MAHSDPTQNMAKARWFLQTVADLKRHEGFRPYAYPDPLSKIGRKYAHPRYRWGFERGDVLLARYGEKEEDGRPWTIGYGFTHGVNPASTTTESLSARKLEAELTEHLAVLDKLLPEWKAKPDYVKTVLANMAYNMGYQTLKQFKNTLREFRENDYKDAAKNLRKSLWYRQVGVRAVELIKRLETGQIDPRYAIPDFSGVTAAVTSTAKIKGDVNE